MCGFVLASECSEWKEKALALVSTLAVLKIRAEPVSLKSCQVVKGKSWEGQHRQSILQSFLLLKVMLTSLKTGTDFLDHYN